MSVSWGAKDPAEIRNYRYDWTGRLDGAEISTATLTVKDGTVALSNVSNDTNSIAAKVSGGEACEDAVIISAIVTDAGETLVETIRLKIESDVVTNGPSTSTKRQIIEMAYEALSMSPYEFDITPEEYTAALRQMDAAMAADEAQSIRLGYNFPDQFGGGDLEDYSGIPDAAIEYASLRLAKAMGPVTGKTLSSEALSRLALARTSARALTAFIPNMPYGYSTPAGAGNRRRATLFGPFLSTRRPC